MSIDYTIKAIPTVYAGRQYRSRLEAKWAAFFDMLGWKVEYEPIDLGAWSPDFQIFTSMDYPLYVEVKPITAIDLATIKKIMAGAANTGDFTQTLLVGVSPFLPTESCPVNDLGLGWSYHWCPDGTVEGGDAVFAQASAGGSIDFQTPGAFFTEISWQESSELPAFDRTALARRMRMLWNASSNAVQWQAR